MSALEVAGSVANTVSHTVSDAVGAVTGTLPRAPPPLPTLPFPSTPPSLPPMEPPHPPLIICPPAAPPPMAPPGFHVWAAQIPSWFWMMFVFMFLIACLGVVAIGYILRELRRQRRGFRLPSSDTGLALAELERRVGLGTDMAGRAGRGRM